MPRSPHQAQGAHQHDAKEYDLPLVRQEAYEAARFYAVTFPDSEVTGDYPGGKKGQVLTVEFTFLGIPCLGLSGGPMFRQTEAFSFQVATDNQEETDRYWDAIVGNGGVESDTVGARTAEASPGRSPRAL